LDKCVLGLKECSEKSPCPMHAQYKNIKRELQELFDSKTIEMLAAEVKSVKSLRY
jgi:DNA-binding IscR family transcriptional regulator